MSYIKTLLSRSPLLKPSINPNNQFLINHPFHKSLSIFFSTQIPNSIHDSINSIDDSIDSEKSSSVNGKLRKNKKKNKIIRKNKRPLDIVFKEALGLCEKEETLSSFSEENDKNGDLKKLYELELQIRQLKAISSKENAGNLEELEGKGGKDVGVSSSKSKTIAAHVDRNVKEGGRSIGDVNEVVYKEISQDMNLLLRHLYDREYFKDVNFLPGYNFDLNCFYEKYARGYIKFALTKFGRDHQEISRWLSGSDMKTVALFGCPSLTKADVFAAKQLRRFFKIDEDTVCGQCVLKNSCEYAKQSVWKSDRTILKLDGLLRLLRAYSLEETHPRLKLTDDLKTCVSRLIREVMNLTKEVDGRVSGGSGELVAGLAADHSHDCLP